jgi:predicted phosphodiesterase
MGAFLSEKEARRTVDAVQAAIKEGETRNQTFMAAANALGIAPSTIKSRVLEGGVIERLYGFKVSWPEIKSIPEQSPRKPATETPVEPVILRRLADRTSKAEARAIEAERRLIKAEALRESVFKLASDPPIPPSWPSDPKPKGNGKHREAIILFLSDLHMGEVIDKEQMGGRNSYNKTIAGKRLARLFNSAVNLGTKHWSGEPPAVIYFVLGGDLISGEIHEELAKTNDLLAIPAVKELAGHIIKGLELLLASFACEIKVISVPGNHGRTTRKPEAKGFALDSYDTLVAWAIESWFYARKESRISFSAPASGDALVNINGWNVLFTHGDRIGSRGGAGMIGPAATVARGMQRLIQDYAAEGTIVDVIVVGHFHTGMELEQGFVNNTLAGPSEYSRSGRMRSSPASQWMLTVHPIYGICRRWKINVGSPEEGSIYKGRL